MENNKEPQHKIAQTYADDMAHALRDGKEGIIKKIIHGEEEHEKQKRNLSPESKKNKFFMLMGIFLVFASVGTLAFFILNREAPSIPVEEQHIPLIFTDKNVLVEIADLKKDEISKRVLTEVNANTVKLGGIEGIYLTLSKAPVGLRKFIEKIEGNFVPAQNNFVDDNFLMGVYKGGTKDLPINSFFILIKIRSITDAFDVMHGWENKMFTDLHGFFGIGFTPETKYLITKNFENGIIENKNARILYSENELKEKKIVMAYVFTDNNSIVITNDENAVREIILRLASSQIKK